MGVWDCSSEEDEDEEAEEDVAEAVAESAPARQPAALLHCLARGATQRLCDAWGARRPPQDDLEASEQHHQVKRHAHALLAHTVQRLHHLEPELAARARQVGWAERAVADAKETETGMTPRQGQGRRPPCLER